jgi:CubicO group peptidase (beta-lactamase class C family)
MTDLDNAITEMMRNGRVPGLSVAVVDRDRQLFAAGFGSADIATGTPTTEATEFLWFSMSKIVTATAAMRLADDGDLDLDAPVHEYVPYLRRSGPKQPTTRQLLDHTSGMGNPMPIRWVHPAASEGPDPEVLLRRQMSRRRAYRYPVGESARYSNLGYLAAGQVISVAAGRPFDDYVRDTVLRPAGMTHTDFRYRPDTVAATGYVRAPRVADPVLRGMLPKGVTGSRHDGYLSLKPFYVDGPAYGGLVGNVVDAGRFLQLHLNDGQLEGNQVLSVEASRRMRRLDQQGKPFDHGIGWFRRPTTGRGDWVEHFGAGAGFWNVMRLYPERGIGVVVMSNSTTTYDFEPLFALVSDAGWS